MWWTLFPNNARKCYWEKSTPKQHYDKELFDGGYGPVFHCPEDYEHDSYDFYIYDQHAEVKMGIGHRVYTNHADTSAYHGELSIIIPVVIAAGLLVAVVLYLVRKRRIAAATPDEVPQLDTEEPIETEAS